MTMIMAHMIQALCFLHILPIMAALTCEKFEDESLALEIIRDGYVNGATWKDIDSQLRNNNCSFDIMPWDVKPPQNMRVSNVAFDGVPVRVYVPGNVTPNSSAIIYIHGGGFTSGTLDRYDEICYWLSNQTSFPVFSVDYRLAPAHVFPAAFNDCVSATLYLMNNAAQYGVDPARVAVMGDSAGGLLAAAVSLRMRDIHHTPPLRMQVLFYPVLLTFNFRLPSNEMIPNINSKYLEARLLYSLGHTNYMEDLLMNKHITQAAWDKFGYMVDPKNLPAELVPANYTPQYTFPDGDNSLWDELKGIITNPYFSPGLAKDLVGLPTTYMLTAGVDPLRDEDILFAQRLEEAGVYVTHDYYCQSFHGMIGVPMLKETARMRDRVIEVLNEKMI